MSESGKNTAKLPASCLECVIRDYAICHSLDAEELDDLNALGRRQHVRRGQTLQWQGDDSMLVGNVIGGVLKLSSSNSDGQDQTLGIVFPGDFIGRPFGAKVDQSIVALNDAQVCVFPRSAFDDFARDHPELEHELLERTLTDLDRARRWMLLLGRKSALGRVAAFLAELAERLSDGSDGEEVHITLPFGRQEIAELLSLKIETVSRQITRLKEDGIIDVPDRRSILVRSRSGLEACAS